MKHKKAQKRLEIRIEDYNKTLRDCKTIDPGSYHKPGSYKH